MNHAAKASQAHLELMPDELISDELVSDESHSQDLRAQSTVAEDAIAEQRFADAPEDKHSLLDELQALKKVLDPGTADDCQTQPSSAALDLAILDDVIPLAVSERLTRSNLLDLDLIFEDEACDHGQAEPGQARRAPTAAVANTQSLDLLVQEIVDELVPLVEDRLRHKLLAMSSDEILKLADIILDS